jgi:flagellar hook assembly protein FlgD
MSFRRSLLFASLLAALVPGSGLAADVGMVSRDVPVGQVDGALRSLSARPAPVTFDMVGLHWRGPGEVWFRTAREQGAWSAWRHARPEDEDQPDRASPEGDRETGWKLGNPYWTGPSRFIQYRLSGRVSRLRAFFLRVPATEAPLAFAARAAEPAIVRRPQWGANESIVRGTPAYADQVRLSVVHHTAGTNSYTRAQAAGIVRGIQRYHVQGNGWNDIGYNFLVDKYGRIYEGRGGGIARNVIGAHAQGFNTGSVGVAVLGTYGSTRISSAARSAVQRLLAWRLDVAHVDPLSVVDAVSFGNDRFKAGTKIRLRAVSGHRDTGYTTCPGTNLYGDLGAIARAVSTIGLPKLYEPEVSGAVGGSVRFTARLSHSRGWAVTVKDGNGELVAEGRGTGRAVDWTWNASSVPFDRYTYVISSGAEVRSASGVVPAPPPLAIRGLRLSNAAITPNGDGVSERTRISFSLSVRANVQVTVLASGSVVRTLLPGTEKPAGAVAVRWNGRDGSGALVPDRRYQVRVAATTDREEVSATRTVVVDRVVGSLSLSREAFSPNGDRRGENVRFGFDLTRTADVRVRVLRGGKAVATLASGKLGTGRHVGSWNGRIRSKVAADGRYKVRVEATTSLGTRTLGRRVKLDTRRPQVGIVSARLVRGVTRLRLALSEPARLRIWYGRHAWYDGSFVDVGQRPAGKSKVWRRVRAGVVRVVAWDAAGNRRRTTEIRVRR